MQLWILITIFAAFMQAVRTALQKGLMGRLSLEAVTWTRFGFGFPFTVLYLLALMGMGFVVPEANALFVLYCLAGGVAGIAATAFLVALFSYRNFAVGTTYAKTEALQTAVLGALLFGEYLSFAGSIAIVMGAFGIVMISLFEKHLSAAAILRAVTQKQALIGVAAGAGFALAGLFIRKAVFALDGDSYIMNAALTLVTMTGIQVAILGSWIAKRDRGAFGEMLACWKPSLLVGITSALGSIGWFTAFALTQAAYVKTVGQVELIFTLFITHKIFKEKVTAKEVMGMLLVVGGILLLAYVG